MCDWVSGNPYALFSQLSIAIYLSVFDLSNYLVNFDLSIYRLPPFDIAYLIMAIHICFTLYRQNTQKIQSKNKYLCAIRLWKVLDLDTMTMHDTCVQCTH